MRNTFFMECTKTNCKLPVKNQYEQHCAKHIKEYRESFKPMNLAEVKKTT